MPLPSITAVYRLAQSPKLKVLRLSAEYPNMPALQLRLAASASRYNRATGKWEDTGKLFIDAELLHQRAADIYPHLRTGTTVVVGGDLITSEWRTDSGETRSKIWIRARTVQVVATLTGPETGSASSPDHPPGHADA